MRIISKRGNLACKAQGIVEYGVCIALIIFAAAAISNYVRRGLQGRYADAVREAQTAAGSTQYEPYYSDSDLVQGNSKQVGQTIGNNNQRTNNVGENSDFKYQQDYPVESDPD